MNTKTGVALGTLIILAVAAIVLFYRSEPKPQIEVQPTIEPLDAPLVPAGINPVKFNPSMDLLRRKALGPDKYALYQELMNKGDGQSLYLAGEIVSACTNVMRKGVDAVLADFQAQIPPGDANRAARLEAFRKLNEPCAGFAPDRPKGQRVMERDELTAMAAERGYLTAIVEVRIRIDAARRHQSGGERVPSYAWVIDVLESGDPAAMNLASGFLTGRPGGYMFDGQPVPKEDRDIAYHAWQMAACERGYPCDLEPALNLCAYDGVCNAKSYVEALRRYLGERFGRTQAYKDSLVAALARKDYRAIGLQ